MARRWSIVGAALAALMVVGCGGGEEPAAEDGATSPPATAADDGASPEAPAGGDGADISACALLTEDEAADVLGAEIAGTEEAPAQGSALSTCTHTTADNQILTVTARPADEFEATVEAYDTTEVSGLGEAAHFDPSVGMLAQPPGTDYFLHVFVVGPEGFGDQDIHVQATDAALS